MENYNVLKLKIEKEQFKIRLKFVKIIANMDENSCILIDDEFYNLKSVIDKNLESINILDDCINRDIYSSIEVYNMLKKINKVLDSYLDCYSDYLKKYSIYMGDDFSDFIHIIGNILSLDKGYNLEKKLNKHYISVNLMLDDVRRRGNNE